MNNYNTETPVTDTPRIIDATIVTKAAPRRFITGKRVAITVGVLLVLGITSFIVLTNRAKDSLPGDSLYNFKTNISEELIARTKLTSTGKANYAVSRLEKRVRELQLLAADNATSSDDALNRIATLSQAHADTVTKYIIEDQSVSLEQKIDSLAGFAGITRAQETIIDDTVEFTPITETISRVESTANDALRSSIDTFASSSDPVTVAAYLEKQIAEVSNILPTVANGSRAQRLATRRINDATEAIADGALGEGIYYILKAKEAIAVDGYLYAAERGFVDGISEEAGPIPEGS